MSIQCVSWVLSKETRTKGTDRLVLLALANHANDLWQAWPSVPLLGREANVADRAVQRSLVNLKQLGIISVERQAAPDKRISADRRPNLYYIHRGVADSTPRGDADSTPDPERGDAGGIDGVSLVTERGATGSTQIIIEPKREPSAPESAVTSTSETPEPDEFSRQRQRWESRMLAPEQIQTNTTNIRDIRDRLRHGDAA